MQLAESVQGATSATERATLIRAFALQFNASEATARRIAGPIRPPAAPKQRDADPVLDQIVARWLGTSTEKYPTPTEPLWRAIDKAETAGVIAPGTLSVGRLQRYIRQHHIAIRDQRRGTPHIWLRSEHPNHVHLADVSVCRQWYLAPDGRVYVQSYRQGTAEYRNKDIRGGVRLYRYVLADHASGALYAQYLTDEAAPSLLTFLAGAWFPKRQRHEVGPTGVERWWPAPFDPAHYAAWAELPLLRDYPFRGAPRVLVLDRAGANQSEFTERLCERLGIKHELAQRARAKGPVESAMWKWETMFEASLADQPAPDLATLNTWALDFLARWSLKRIHTRHGMTRTQAWALITREQLREPPDWPTFQELATREPVARSVKSGDAGGFVRYGAHLWRVADIELVGQRVHVWPAAFDADTLRARTASGRVIVLERVHRDRFGFPDHAATIGEQYRSHPDTATQQSLKRLEAVRAALPPLDIFGRDGERHDTPALLGPRDGVPIALNGVGGEHEISKSQFNKRVVGQLGRAFTEEEGAERDRRWAGQTTMPVSAVDEFVAWCRAREVQPSSPNVRRLFG